MNLKDFKKKEQKMKFFRSFLKNKMKLKLEIKYISVKCARLNLPILDLWVVTLAIHIQA